MRINTLAYVYYDIAINEYITSKKAEKKIERILEDIGTIDSEEKLEIKIGRSYEFDLIIQNSYLKCVVFTAMLIEANIYDLSANILGDKYTMDHLDRIPILDKWIIIPKLISDKSISTEGKFYYLLKKIIITRNKLIHSKSHSLNYERFTNDEKYRSKHSLFNEKNISINECLELLFLSYEEIIKIIPDINTLEMHMPSKKQILFRYPELINYIG